MVTNLLFESIAAGTNAAAGRVVFPQVVGSCIVVVWVWVPPIGFPPIPNTVFSFMGGAIQSAFRAISSLSCEALSFFYI